MTARSRELRHHPNFPEAILWHELRGSRFARFKFRRQHVIGPYIVDFYCARSGVVVELDGVTHRGREAADRTRHAWLEGQGLRVIRCRNEELYENLEGLLEAVYRACFERSRRDC